MHSVAVAVYSFDLLRERGVAGLQAVIPYALCACEVAQVPVSLVEGL